MAVGERVQLGENVYLQDGRRLVRILEPCEGDGGGWWAEDAVTELTLRIFPRELEPQGPDDEPLWKVVPHGSHD